MWTSWVQPPHCKIVSKSSGITIFFSCEILKMFLLFFNFENIILELIVADRLCMKYQCQSVQLLGLRLNFIEKQVIIMFYSRGYLNKLSNNLLLGEDYVYWVYDCDVQSIRNWLKYQSITKPQAGRYASQKHS